MSPISVHNLPRLHISNVNRCNERKWFYTKKRQEADDTPDKLLRMQTMRFWQIHLLVPPSAVWSRQ